jgi:hypothetical protein
VKEEPGAYARRAEEEQLTRAVLGYLEEHPGAMDTLDGIADFWVARNVVRVEVTRLSRVLHKLVELGVLEEIKRAQGSFFRLSLPAAASESES